MKRPLSAQARAYQLPEYLAAALTFIPEALLAHQLYE